MGLFRSVALETSRRLELRDERFQSDAAFFLTLDEMKATLRTRPVDALTLVTRRRRAYQGYLRMPDPPHTFTGHPPPVAEPLPTDSRMKGLAASAGIAEGRARVLHRPEQAGEFECDEVLVVSVADVGWSPLFLAASAVVTDLGGPLSHASVVLREYGIPAVVNLHVGTRCIRTGDLIRVDGERGWVEILERADGT
jgi:pyruvate,water dikinase